MNPNNMRKTLEMDVEHELSSSIHKKESIIKIPIITPLSSSSSSSASKMSETFDEPTTIRSLTSDTCEIKTSTTQQQQQQPVAKVATKFKIKYKSLPRTTTITTTKQLEPLLSSKLGFGIPRSNSISFEKTSDETESKSIAETLSITLKPENTINNNKTIQVKSKQTFPEQEMIKFERKPPPPPPLAIIKAAPVVLTKKSPLRPPPPPPPSPSISSKSGGGEKSSIIRRVSSKSKRKSLSSSLKPKRQSSGERRLLKTSSASKKSLKNSTIKINNNTVVPTTTAIQQRPKSSSTNKPRSKPSLKSKSKSIKRLTHSMKNMNESLKSVSIKRTNSRRSSLKKQNLNLNNDKTTAAAPPMMMVVKEQQSGPKPALPPPIMSVEKEELIIVRQPSKLSPTTSPLLLEKSSITETMKSDPTAAQTFTTNDDDSTTARSSTSHNDRVTVIREVHKNISGEPVVEKVKAKIVTSTGSKLSDNIAIEKESLIHNCIIYILSQILASILLVLFCSLIIQHFGGFPYEILEHSLNYHPLFMFIALVMVTSRQLTNICRLPLLIGTLVLQLTGTFITIYWHAKKEKSHMQSMHSWFGLMTIILFLTYLAGNIYLYSRHEPKKENERQKFLNRISKSIFYVRMIGLGCLVMASITCLLGLNQFEDIFNGIPSDLEHSTTGNPSSPRLLTNIASIFLIIYVGFMAYLIARQRYRSSETIEFEKQVQMAVDNAMQQMDASGVFNNPDERSRLSLKSDDDVRSLSPEKNNRHRHHRRRRRSRSDVQDSLKSPRISVCENTQKYSTSSSLLKSITIT
ncbi:uncharacterized protein LOC124490909 isoform X2 [Dermatophagoides farinae]|uniref:uncharacterized protein LOC124490909 isoform X2 n=1 Tax=Dermatophagoides farinae TaxID=6954 RepID=UPI003F62C23F